MSVVNPSLHHKTLVGINESVHMYSELSLLVIHYKSEFDYRLNMLCIIFCLYFNLATDLMGSIYWDSTVYKLVFVYLLLTKFM